VSNSSVISEVAQGERFVPGAVVLATLNSPREKYWGAVIELNVAGLSIRGIDLNSFEDFIGLVRENEPVSAGAVFFPMHRVERIELDVRNGAIPSLSDRFQAKTGRTASAIFGVQPTAVVEIGCSLLEAERRFVLATLAAMQDDYLLAARVLGTTEERLRLVVNPADPTAPKAERQ